MRSLLPWRIGNSCYDFLLSADLHLLTNLSCCRNFLPTRLRVISAGALRQDSVLSTSTAIFSAAALIFLHDIIGLWPASIGSSATFRPPAQPSQHGASSTH